MIRTLKILMIFIPLLTAVSPSIVWGVAPYPFQRPPEENQGAIIRAGEPVCLFESGTADVKQVINVNDVLEVFRENPDHTFKKVGKIKVIFYGGENFIRAQVIEGELKINDIAKKGNVASLVILSATGCQ